MFYAIDKITNEIAMLQGDDMSTLQLPVSALPEGAKEGDVLQESEGVFLPAPEETSRRRAKIENMLAHLLHKEDDK